MKKNILYYKGNILAISIKLRNILAKLLKVKNFIISIQNYPP